MGNSEIFAFFYEIAYHHQLQMGSFNFFLLLEKFKHFKVFRYIFLGDHTSLLKSALRQSLFFQINVKFVILVGLGLNVVYIL